MRCSLGALPTAEPGLDARSQGTPRVLGCCCLWCCDRRWESPRRACAVGACGWRWLWWLWWCNVRLVKLKLNSTTRSTQVQAELKKSQRAGSNNGGSGVPTGQSRARSAPRGGVIRVTPAGGLGGGFAGASLRNDLRKGPKGWSRLCVLSPNRAAHFTRLGSGAQKPPPHAPLLLAFSPLALSPPRPDRNPNSMPHG